MREGQEIWYQMNEASRIREATDSDLESLGFRADPFGEFDEENISLRVVNLTWKEIK